VVIYSLKDRTAEVVEQMAMMTAAIRAVTDPANKPIKPTTQATTHRASAATVKYEKVRFSGLVFWDCPHEETYFELEIEGEVVFGDFGVPVGVIGVLSFLNGECSKILVIGTARQFKGVEEILNRILELGLDTDGVGVERVRNQIVGMVRGLERVVVCGHG